MNTKPSPRPSCDYLEDLKSYANNFEMRGPRRYFDLPAMQAAVAAVRNGVPRNDVVKTLKISMSTIHKWEKRLTKMLGKKTLNKLIDQRKNIPVQTLKVAEPPETAKQSSKPVSHNEVVEMRFGSVLIKIFGGGE